MTCRDCPVRGSDRCPIARRRSDRSRPAAGLFEVSLADGRGRRRGGARLRSGSLSVGADRRDQRLECEVELEAGIVPIVRVEVENAPIRLGGDPPRPHRLDAFVADAVDMQVGVGHRALLPHAVHERDPVAREPHGHPGVDRALVRPDADAGEHPRVDDGVVAVEVVRLAPRRVALDIVGKVVARIEQRHRPPFVDRNRRERT